MQVVLFTMASTVVPQRQSAASGMIRQQDPLGQDYRNTWPLYIRQHEGQIHSQWNQDGVLQYIFESIGVTNKYFVEFGFDRNEYVFGANTHLLYEAGWRGLLMDGGHENATINLHREMISIDTIVDLFKKYKVPKEPDYVSVDLDSCDIWVMMEIAKAYRPRVMTVEYNSNFPAGATLAWPPTCAERWQGDTVFGSSVGAIYLAAQEVGYTVVHGIPVADLFLVRRDLLSDNLHVHSLSTIEQWVSGRPLHPRPQNASRFEIFIDYAAYRSNGEDIEKSRQEALKYLGENTNFFTQDV